MAQEMTDDEIMDLIREGHTSKDFESDIDFWTEREYSLEDIKRAIRLAKDYESGKLKLEMSEEDKKRLIKKNIVLYKRLGFSDEDVEEIVRDIIKKFIPLTEKKKTG